MGQRLQGGAHLLISRFLIGPAKGLCFTLTGLIIRTACHFSSLRYLELWTSGTLTSGRYLKCRLKGRNAMMFKRLMQWLFWANVPVMTAGYLVQGPPKRRTHANTKEAPNRSVRNPG